MKAAASKQGAASTQVGGQPGVCDGDLPGRMGTREADVQMSQIPPFSVSLVENADGR